MSCEGGGTSGTERTASSSVMSNPYLVQNILDFVGPGQHLYVSTISKVVRQCYSTIQPIKLQVLRLSDGTKQTVVVHSQMTLHSEMCRSESRLMLAVQCGVQIALQGSPLQRTAEGLLAKQSSFFRRKLAMAEEKLSNLAVSLGRYADQALLTCAYDQLGLPCFSAYITMGAVMSGDLDKLQWLYLVECAVMFSESSILAARYGHTHILKWFYQIKFPIHAKTCREAALQGRLGVLKLLHFAGHTWNKDTCEAAVEGGHVEVLQWLGEHGCAYDVTAMARRAAYCGHAHILDWLVLQQGARVGVDLMQAAARGGQLHMCQYLRSIGCAWDASVCDVAACAGQLSVLQYLHENGCPWAGVGVAMVSARSGSIATMAYALQHTGPQLVEHANVVLSDMLRTAGAHGHLAAAKWLRYKRSAQWPAVLSAWTEGERRQ
jgi:hypothetical protein